jgi:hypothetical protein
VLPHTLLIMVALEPGEPLLLYVTAMADAISMELVTERPETLLTLASKGVAASGSGSQDPKPT